MSFSMGCYQRNPWSTLKYTFVTLKQHFGDFTSTLQSILYLYWREHRQIQPCPAACTVRLAGGDGETLLPLLPETEGYLHFDIPVINLLSIQLLGNTVPSWWHKDFSPSYAIWKIIYILFLMESIIVWKIQDFAASWLPLWARGSP